ncbi:MAG: ABC transporter ATP-binding protein [Spirochaetales bacterium]|nr:ABC transporter ATP-binding protein [Spirochaetales bacterium]
MQTVVEVEHLAKKFGDFVAVDDISFNVQGGEVFGFLGPNGAGKSTTIKMLCGILLPTSGDGHVFGRDIYKEQYEIKQSIGYMSQRFSLYDDLSVMENLEFFGSIYELNPSFLRKRIGVVLRLSGITKEKNWQVKKLPIGIKQRLALGTAIIHDPPLLFLDEPTSGVDPLMRRNFWDLIYNFAEQGKTIFVTTHYMDEADHCDRIALITNGRLIAVDSPNNLKRGLPYTVYVLRAQNYMQLFDKVKTLSFISEASMFGRDIHLLCEKKQAVKRELRTYLRKWGFEAEIEQIVPALEDVFVTSVKRQGY